MSARPLDLKARGVKPLAIDLLCGLGGWTEGLLAEGYRVIGFDNERHEYGGEKYPAQLVLQDVLTLHGSQFRDAALIVASPPCQEYSYMAMPWTRAKAKAAAIRADETGAERARLNALFDACFRIQREACEAAGRHVPLVVENVRGAQPWVGRARWNYGSFYLWGDVPALMPFAKYGVRQKYGKVCHSPQEWERVKGGEVIPHPHVKNPGFRFDGSGRSLQSESVNRHAKNPGHLNQRDGHGHTRHLTNPAEHGTKHGGDWFGSGADCSEQRHHGSRSNARKAASAKIAKIPLALARHVARAWWPADAIAGDGQ
jgi:hypothetical protein